MAEKRFHWYQAFVKETSKLRWYILPLIGLSMCDILVTYCLLLKSPHYYESNPVAHWLFSRYDIAGMIFLKFGGVALAVLIAEYVEHHRPGLGKFILLFGLAVTAAVVGYGLRLYYVVPVG